MKNKLAALLLALTCVWWRASVVHACGGFFCSSSPVDQNAERIIFSVDDAAGTTDMIVQITYQGKDDGFAWLLPVASVPQNRQVFPKLAMSSFDGQSGPVFQPPPQCFNVRGPTSSAGIGVKAPAAASDSGMAPVVVFVMETIDAYDVAVIQSDSADATYQWLVDNGYRLSSVMKPYIELYTQQKMLFLALKLTADATTQDIKPFKMTLPGTTPSIPLRLTAIAAEPEMGVVAWILGQQRYEPANSDEITIAKEELRWRPYSLQTNWTQLVAQHVNERGGRGWVVEQAGSTDSLQQSVKSTFVNGQDQYTAQQALLTLLSGRPYMTRLYTRVSAEEMGYDPSFRRSDKPDVSRTRELPYIAEICSPDAGQPPPAHECDFSACGSLGVCAETLDKPTQARVAGCACAPGTTARTTSGADGTVSVTCQDQRMSFMNPGESDLSGMQFADPCVGFSCGEHGACVAMNLTPTCACEQGYIAVGAVSASGGARATTCVQPTQAVDKSFYNRRPPALADGMMAGREVTLPAPIGAPDRVMPARYGDPMPATPAAVAPSSHHDGCQVALGGTANVPLTLAALLAPALLFLRRRRSR